MSKHGVVQNTAPCSPGIDFRVVLEEMLEDPEFRREWEAGELEYQIRREIIRERLAQGLTQSELAEACGMNQRVLSRVETGATMPTVRTLEKIAKGLGRRLVIRFEPV